MNQPDQSIPSKRTLRGDIFGGLTAAVVALPLALAFGVASGAGALAGLYGAILTGFFAAVFGGTPSQVTGPTGPMTVAMAVVITNFADRPALAFTVVIMAGALQIVFGLSRLGGYINFVPYSVISGFMSGIGAIIILLQLGPLAGHAAPAGAMIDKLAALPSLLAQPDLQALCLGALTLAIVFACPARIGRIVPPSLIALIIGTLAGVFYFSAAPAIGEIPSGFPRPHLPSFTLHDFPVMLRWALVLAFLGSIDSLLTSLIADSVTRGQHHSNRELIGQGIGNMVAGLFGAIPGAGATMRTVVNVRAGGRTRLSGALHALILLSIALGFSGAAAKIPLAVLAGILIKVGVDIIDWRYIRVSLRHPRPGSLIMLATLVLTVVTDLVTAVATGIIMASLLFVKRTSDVQMKEARLVSAPSEAPDLSEEESAILDRAAGRIVLFALEGPLSFGSAKTVARLLTSSRQSDVLIINLSAVPFIDGSAALALEEIVTAAKRDGDAVLLCGLRPKVTDALQRFHVLDLLGPNAIHPTRADALRAADQLLA